MIRKLKVDFHTHTSEDPTKRVAFDASRLIDEAARKGFDAVSVTNRDVLTYDDKLARRAEDRGVLLIPGMEAHFSERHVLIINPPFVLNPKGRRLEDLADIRTDETLVIAPHPYFPGPKSLRLLLIPHIQLFDAVEVSQFRTSRIDFNRRAIEVAARFGKPLVATSDCRHIRQFGDSFTLVEAEKNILSIIRSVRCGRVEARCPVLGRMDFLRIMAEVFLEKLSCFNGFGFLFARIRNGRKRRRARRRP